jgi:BirA family biotin operon repressor/biotin-[acetyl-CoA-carboxylase] ligase
MSALDVSDRLSAEKLRIELAGSRLGREIIVLDKTTSTNDSILQRLTSDSPEGLVIFAEYQTAGRGQRGRRWESSAHKGLWFSILLRPKIAPRTSPRLTAWAAETIANTITRELSLQATITAPNDVCIDGRKVAGVLVEMRAQNRAAHVAIAGIGINVNQVAEDFSMDLRDRAISLAMAAHQTIDRSKFAIALLRNLDRAYQELLGE